VSFYNDKHVIVTGANRGIGLALSRHLLTQGAYVYAGARQPDKAAELQALRQKFGPKLHIAALDVQRVESINAFVKVLADKPVDVLINNAGVNLDHGRRIQELPADVLAQTFDANTLGPYRMVQSFLAGLHRAKRPVVANISSIMGSIAENQSGGNTAYRVSKTATNMLTKCLAIEETKLIALTLHPGWVKTRMGGDNAQIDVDTSASGLLDVISRAKPEDSGKYFRYSGEQAAW
jgi:NAD(P)-dependent dehydrogenase (short-subunit alcohol dehydrogenase family)